jgi:hypothetical protein
MEMVACQREKYLNPFSLGGCISVCGDALYLPGSLPKRTRLDFSLMLSGRATSHHRIATPLHFHAPNEVENFEVAYERVTCIIYELNREAGGSHRCERAERPQTMGLLSFRANYYNVLATMIMEKNAPILLLFEELPMPP